MRPVAATPTRRLSDGLPVRCGFRRFLLPCGAVYEVLVTCNGKAGPEDIRSGYDGGKSRLISALNPETSCTM